MPSERLRKLEIDANAAFDQYREMYFEGGVSSVYLWDLDHGFAGQYRSLKTVFRIRVITIRIRTRDLWIRILLFSSRTSKMPTKICLFPNLFCLLLLHQLSKILSHY
jgi:hypothetical protein